MSSAEDPAESDDDVEEVNKRRKKRASLTASPLVLNQSMVE